MPPVTPSGWGTMDIPATATTPTTIISTTPPGTAGISTGAEGLKAIAGDTISVNREAEGVIVKAITADVEKAGEVTKAGVGSLRRR